MAAQVTIRHWPRGQCQYGGPAPTGNNCFDFLKHVILNYKFLYRYVLHNSMLEGYGILSQKADEHTVSPIDRYVLRDEQVNRHMFYHELTAGLALRYANLQLRLLRYSPEYDLPVNTKMYAFPPDNQVAGNHNRSKYNHVGTLGLFFKL